MVKKSGAILEFRNGELARIFPCAMNDDECRAIYKALARILKPAVWENIKPGEKANEAKSRRLGTDKQNPCAIPS